MLRRPLIKLIPVAIVLFWAVMMGLLAWRELAHRWDPARLVARHDAQPTDSWMALMLPGGMRIGFVNVQTLPERRFGLAGTRLSLQARMSMQILGRQTGFHLLGNAWSALEGEPATLDFKVRSEGQTLRFEADLRDGFLDGKLHTGGEAHPIRLPVQKGVLLSGSLGTAAMDLSNLTPGRRVVIDAFDPMTLSMGKTTIECVGEERITVGGESFESKALKVTANNITMRAWVDANGETLRAETPFGFVLERTTPEDALREAAPRERQDFMTMASIQPQGKRPFRGARRMVVVVGGVEPEHSPPSEYPQLSDDGARFVITQPDPPGERSTPQDQPFPADDLLPHPLIQSDHPRIVETAGAIVGDTSDPWQKALLLYEWVYANVRKTVVLSVPSALEVLSALEGDCNEHTVLHVALARAAGLPARVALGVVWSGELNGFYYHAWPEVYVDGWVPMDPTLGQPLADATHIKLLTGNIEQWPRLMPYIGRLELQIEEVE